MRCQTVLADLGRNFTVSIKRSLLKITWLLLIEAHMPWPLFSHTITFSCAS